MKNNHSIGKLGLWLLGLLVVLVIVFAIRPGMSRITTMQVAPQEKALSEKIRTGETSIPEYTPAVAAKVAASNGFQALASYTDRGFEPAEIAIKSGETVRFTNNSSDNLWVASGGDMIYPRTKPMCGSSDLDSCGALAPMDFYEFTFAQAGEWVVVNNLDKGKMVVVVVE